jgi:hypothetical protein
VQLGALNEPPVKVSVKVTVPVGAFAGVVISATVAVTLAVQLVAGGTMVQVTFGTLVDVLSLVTVTETVVLLERPPLLPVTGTLNVATFAQVTDKAAPVNEPEQPVGKTKPALTVHVTAPENPLIGAAVQVEVPGTVARVVIAGQDGVKSWKVN